jgi:hypothetical protein
MAKEQGPKEVFFLILQLSFQMTAFMISRLQKQNFAHARAKVIKLLLFFILWIPASKGVMAQDGGLKNFRFGLKIAPNVAWFKPADSKRLISDGTAMRFSYGLMTEFKLSNSASLLTGVEYASAGGSLLYTASDSIFYDPRSYITDLPSGSDAKFFLTKRVFTNRYIDLPLTIKLRTPEIGKMTYFGIFGFNLSVRTNARSKDEGTLETLVKKNDTTTIFQREANVTLEDVDITTQVQLFRAGLNAGLGFEYSLAGTTCLVFGVTFNQGLTNALKKLPEELKFDRIDGFKFSQISKNHIVQVTIGVLF